MNAVKEVRAKLRDKQYEEFQAAKRKLADPPANDPVAAHDQQLKDRLTAIAKLNGDCPLNRHEFHELAIITSEPGALSAEQRKTAGQLIAKAEKKTKAQPRGRGGMPVGGKPAPSLVRAFRDGFYEQLQTIWEQGTAGSVTSDDITWLGDLLRRKGKEKGPITDQEFERARDIRERAGEAKPLIERPAAEIAAACRAADARVKAKAVPGNVPRPVGGLASIDVALNCIHRHPKNRKAEKSAVKELAASIDELELQQPILLRKPPNGSMYPLASGHYQIVFGERRFAAHELLGRKTIRAFVREDLDDVGTLKLMAIENAKREDLDPVERARLIKTLTDPLEQDGGGLQVKEAAPLVGFADASSASNALRILKLPPKWLDRVASGELPETFARLLIPICHAPKLMDVLETSWAQHHKGKQCDLCWRDVECWESRSSMERMVETLLEDFTRPVDGETHRYGHDELHRAVPRNYWEYSGEYPILFDADQATTEQLDVQEFTVGKQARRLATNVKLYDKLQVPCIRQQVDQKRSKAAAKQGREKPAVKKELTPAQKKARAKQQADQLARRISIWRHDWLKTLVVRELDENNTALRERLLVAIALREIEPIYASKEDVDEAAHETARKYGAKSSDTYDALVELGRDEEGLWDVGLALVKAAVAAENGNPDFPLIPHARMDEIADFAGIDLALEWGVMQEAHRAEYGESAAGSRFGDFFQLFQMAQLDELGTELGVHVADAKGKEAKVKLLVSRDRNLKLPKCIKPLVAKKPAKRRRR